jgi:Tol biopolymer transport system component
MPYEAGQSLRERLERESELPIRDVVRFLHDVADALTHAHAHGLVHRDIKPENVMLSGRHALVTDFGVAKAVSEATGRQQLTTMGVALGTPTYMAPEQASADPNIDARADIYALGILAYELLTGQPPFMGNTPQAILAAQVSQLPRPVQEHRPTVPPALAALVMRCLEKRPADRFQSAEELLPILESLNTPSGGVTPMGTAPYQATAASTVSRRSLVSIAGTALVVAAVAWLGWQRLRPAELAITLENIRQVTRDAEPEFQVALSPDGREVAYAAGWPFSTRIVVRDIAGGRPIELSTDWGGSQRDPEWWPDGRTVWFSNSGRGADRAAGPWRIPRTGGQATRLREVNKNPELHAGHAILLRGDSILAVDADGRETLLVAGADEVHSEAWRPDGTAVAFVVGNSAWPSGNGNIAPSEIWVTPIGGTAVRVVAGPAMNLSPAWLPDGTLLYVSDRDGGRDVYAIRIDRDGRPDGEPRRITTGLDPFSISVAADGRTIAYDRFVVRSNLYLLSLPATGTVSIREATPVTRGNQQIENFDVSHDGRQVVFDSDLQGTRDLYLASLGGGEPARVTTSPGGAFSPGLSADGGEVAYHTFVGTGRQVMLVNIDGSNPRQLSDDSTQQALNPSVSSDGLRVAYGTNPWAAEDPRAGVYVVSRPDLSGEWGQPVLLQQGGFGPQWSPVADELVMTTSPDGMRPDGGIAVVTLDGTARFVTRPDDGLHKLFSPDWSGDGRSIYFTATDDGGSPGFYRVPAAGGIPVLVVTFDEPSMSIRSRGAVVRGGNAYFSIAEVESDIWVADLVVH